MKPKRTTRRAWLFGLTTLFGGVYFARWVAAMGRTPTALEGPFYPTPSMRMADVDNDLVKVVGLVREAGGEVITLKGRVKTKAGEPLAGYRVEIWQCDVNGKYLHPGDRQSVAYDQGFQGFGHDVTGPDGSYTFRTIKPVQYPGRTPHIHVKVLAGGRERLTTQLYLKDHPANLRDNLYSRMSAAQAEAVSMVFSNGPEGAETQVDLVI